jgi:hypothetical protein
MLYSGKTIVGRIRGHIKKRGGAYSAWVVGISKEPRGSLFTKHGVRKVGDFWILMHAETHKIARSVRLFLTSKLSLTRGSGPEDPAADFVYAYKKSANTKP